MIKKTNFTQKTMKLPQVALESVMQICAAYDKWGEFLVGGGGKKKSRLLVYAFHLAFANLSASALPFPQL